MGEADTEVRSSRKRKEKSETDNSDVCPAKKVKKFCCQTFRQKLKGSEVLKSLKEFIAASKVSDEVVSDYLESGGSVKEILSIIDVTAAEDLTTALPVFETVHLLLLRCLSADSKHHMKCVESGRNILRSHILTIKAMLSMDVSKHKKVALKVLTAIATLDTAFANEIMNLIALSPTLITDFIQPSPEKDSVRKCFIMFVLSFLIEGNVTVIKNLLDKKGFLGSIIPGLRFDDATTVNVTLSVFEEKILRNVNIQKTYKLKLFNTQIIKSLFDLYEWKGPDSIGQISVKKKHKVKEVVIDQNEKDLVLESVHSFLLLLCCSSKYGVAFQDKSFGASDGLNNQLLLTVFESIPDPLKTKKTAEILLKTIVSCPDLMKPLLFKLEPFFQPRNSKNWLQAMDFAENLLKSLDVVATMVKAEKEFLTASDLVKIGKNLCAPVTFLRVVKSVFQRPETLEIQFRGLSLLTNIWRETQNLIGASERFSSEVKRPLYRHLLKSLPDGEDLIELWHTLCDVEFFGSLSLTEEKKIDFLSAVLQSFHIMLECQRGATSSSLALVSDLLQNVEVIKESLSNEQFARVQEQIVKLMEADVQFLTPTLELFDKSLGILLQSTDDSCLSYLSRIFVGLEVFSRNEAEVDVWLSSYWSTARERRAKFADLLIVSLKHVNGNKEVWTEESEIFTGVSDGNSLSISPLIFNCIELVKLRSSRSPKKNEKKYVYFAEYLNNVAVHLQFFYGAAIYLHDQLKQFGQVFSESTLSFLQGWKETRRTLPGPGVSLCPSEFALASWIVNDEHDSRTVKEIIDAADANLLELYSLFRMVVAYLTKKSVDGELSAGDVEKFGHVLPLFLRDVAEDERGVTRCISFNLTDRSVYQRACLECLFRSEHLLERFNVFQRKRTADDNATALVVEILMRKGLVKSRAIKKTLTEPWKMKFLKQLKSKLKKGKFIDVSSGLEVVLEFFDFGVSDADEVLNLFVDMCDVDLFVNGDSLSAWTTILTSFVKFHCEEKELSEAIMEKLCLIMNRLCESFPSDPLQMIDCFVNLLRKHPTHLLRINNEFLDVILLKRNFSSAICTLGKLLLNDPKKVDYFLELVEKNLTTLKEPRTALCLLSNLIVNEDSSRDAIFFQENRSVWKITEIGAAGNEKLYQVFKAVYKHFQPNIIRLLLGEKGTEEGDFFLENIDFTRHLVRLFLDKEKMDLVKGDIAKGTFQPTLLYEAVRKVSDFEMSEMYLRGLLVAFCRMVRNQERGIDWNKYCDVVSDLVRFGEGFPRQRVVEMLEWRDFARLAVGHSLNSVKDSSLLRIFRLLVTALYDANEESKDCALFFQMFIAHSQFLKVMLSESLLKSEAVELLFRLVERAPSQMSPKHFPVLLASYGAGMSSRDATLLEILRLYETSGVAVSAYEPFVWGETAVSHYSIGTSPGLSLWQRFNMKNVLDLIDGHRLELSLGEFPIRRSLKGGVDESGACDANIYDPAFLLPLFSSLMSPGAVVYSLAFIYKGGLAYTVRALSSECKDIRLMASLVLTRFYNHLELSQNLKQKLVWMHFINRLRYGIDDLSSRVLPNVTTLFLARMTLELSRHPAEMYSPLQKYLLAKPYFLFDTVPEFLPLFHSAEISYWKHREWLLEVLRDGTKTSLDVSTVFHSMAPKVIFCFFCSEICDSETKKLILQVLERTMRVGKSVLLISEYGLLSWISAMDFASCQPILHNLLELLSTLTRVIVREIKLHRNKFSNMSHLIQILNVALKLMESVKSANSVETFKTYLKIFSECLILFFKEKQYEWFELNESCLFDLMHIGTEILGEKLDCRKLVKVPFYFRSFDNECGECEECEKYEIGMDLKDCVYLFGLLSSGRRRTIATGGMRSAFLRDVLGMQDAYFMQKAEKSRKKPENAARSTVVEFCT